MAPIVLGQGKQLFQEGDQAQLHPVNAKVYASGMLPPGFRADQAHTSSLEEVWATMLMRQARRCSSQMKQALISTRLSISAPCLIPQDFLRRGERDR
jgi:hypothetical protein